MRMKRGLPYIIMLTISIIEFVLIFHKVIFQGLTYDPFPKAVTFSSNFNIIYLNYYAPLYNVLVTFPLTLISIMTGFSTTNIIMFLNFELQSLGMFYATRHFIGKFYSSRPLFVLPYYAATLYPIVYYVQGPLSFYSTYEGLLPLIISLLDKLTDIKPSDKRDSVMQAIGLAFILSLGFLDIRTISYTIFIFIILVVFKKVFSSSPIISIKTLFLMFPFLLLFNFQYVFFYLATKELDLSIVANFVSAQLFIAYQKFHILNSFAGSESWLKSLSYNDSSLILGIIIPTGAFATLLFKKNYLILFLATIILLIVGYAAWGASLNEILGQTHVYPFLVILYPDYLMSILYSAPVIILFSLGLCTILSLSKNKKRKIVSTIFVMLIAITSLVYYLPYAHQLSQTKGGISPPNGMEQVLDKVYQHTPGLIYVISNNFTAVSFIYNAPNVVPNPIYYGETLYYNLPYYFMLQNNSITGKALAYLGIQYILLYGTQINNFNMSTGLTPLYKNNGYELYNNTNYLNESTQSGGIYITYDFPTILSKLAHFKGFFVQIPFYMINNYSSTLPLVKGIIVNSFHISDIIPMFFENNSWIINAEQLTVNDPHGWYVIPNWWLGDNYYAIGPYSKQSTPLNIHVELPKGKYQVYVEGTTIFGANSSLTIKSGNNYVNANFTENLQDGSSVYYPVPQWINAGTIFLNSQDLSVYSNTKFGAPAFTKIVLVPINQLKPLEQKAETFLINHTLIDFNLTDKPFGVNMQYNISNGIPYLIHPGSVNKKVMSAAIFSNYYNLFNSLITEYSVPNSIFHGTYFYGSGQIFIVKTLIIKNIEYSTISTLIINYFIDILLLFIYSYCRKHRS